MLKFVPGSMPSCVWVYRESIYLGSIRAWDTQTEWYPQQSYSLTFADMLEIVSTMARMTNTTNLSPKCAELFRELTNDNKACPNAALVEAARNAEALNETVLDAALARDIDKAMEKL